MLKFCKFCTVGLIGAGIQSAIVWILTEKFGLWYMYSLMFGIAAAVTWNFGLNSIWTFRQEKNPSDADYEWNAFFNGNIVQKWWKQSIAKTVWEFVPNSSILLDIACGSSPIIVHYDHAVGIDINFNKLAFMKEKCQKIDFRNMSADKLEFNDNCIDNVLCLEVIEHLKNPLQVISEIARVTKTGGKVAIATPDYSRWHWYIAEMFTQYKKEHITKFNRKKLELVCTTFGLMPIKYKYIAGCDLIELFEKR